MENKEEIYMENDYWEVNYEKYCQSCIHKKKAENSEPCSECLEEPIRLYSEKPVKWEGK